MHTYTFGAYALWQLCGKEVTIGDCKVLNYVLLYYFFYKKNHNMLIEKNGITNEITI